MLDRWSVMVVPSTYLKKKGCLEINIFWFNSIQMLKSLKNNSCKFSVELRVFSQHGQNPLLGLILLRRMNFRRSFFGQNTKCWNSYGWQNAFLLDINGIFVVLLKNKKVVSVFFSVSLDDAAPSSLFIFRNLGSWLISDHAWFLTVLIYFYFFESSSLRSV